MLQKSMITHIFSRMGQLFFDSLNGDRTLLYYAGSKSAKMTAESQPWFLTGFYLGSQVGEQ
jgi:hypothetical protein